jgi:Domain of unknown function (DUF5658)
LIVHVENGLFGPETHFMSAKAALISAFVALQIADVLTTQHILAAGGFEANPLEVWAIEQFGAWWPLAKLAPMARVAVVMTRWRPRHVVPAVALMAAVVASNAVQGDNAVFGRLILFLLAVSCACWAAYRAGDGSDALSARLCPGRSDGLRACRRSCVVHNIA